MAIAAGDRADDLEERLSRFATRRRRFALDLCRSMRRALGRPAHRTLRPDHSRLRACLLVTALLIPLSGCQGDSASPIQDTIDREMFIDTYVALRVEGLAAPNQIIPPEVRDRILADRGLDADDLLAFTEVYGADVDFMRDVWDEIEERLEDLRTRPDTGQNRS